jgi:clan AA aspartic protease (TIGR02281 family)
MPGPQHCRIRIGRVIHVSLAAFGALALALVAMKALGYRASSMLAVALPGLEVAPIHPRDVVSGGPRDRDRHLVVDARSNGQFATKAVINGIPIDVLIDTGATYLSFSQQDAATLGLTPRPDDYTVAVQTAGGMSRLAPMVVDEVRVGDIVLHNVSAAVSEASGRSVTLLGMTFLGRLTRVEVRGKQLHLVH